MRRFFSSQVTKQHPLNGIRILDLTRIVAGPYCTQILGDLGADVIKVERPGVGEFATTKNCLSYTKDDLQFLGDESRKWGPPFLPNSTDSVYFLASNRNKRSVAVNLKKGSHIISELAKQCDVLVENYVPGKLDEFGLGYSQLQPDCPRLIYTSITGYGSHGPYSDRPGYDVIAASVGGLLGITGPTDGAPCKVGVAMTDIATGLYAHGAILAALLHREKTGRGERIEVNLLSTQVASLINVGSNWLNAGHEAKRWGTAHESIVPYQSFKTQSGYLTVGAGSNQQFVALCDFLNAPELASDEKYRTNQDRVRNRDELIKVLTEIFETKSNQEWMKILKTAPFPVGPVNSVKEVFEDRHVQAIEIVKTVPHSVAGDVKVVGPPVEYQNIRNDVRSAPPTLGQHTDEVLKDILGYDDGKLQNLRQTGVIQ